MSCLWCINRSTHRVPIVVCDSIHHYHSLISTDMLNKNNSEIHGQRVSALHLLCSWFGLLLLEHSIYSFTLRNQDQLFSRSQQNTILAGNDQRVHQSNANLSLSFYEKKSMDRMLCTSNRDKRKTVQKTSFYTHICFKRTVIRVWSKVISIVNKKNFWSRSKLMNEDSGISF